MDEKADMAMEVDEKGDFAVKESHHAKKYDRQMRLWGKHGQMAIERAHICVLGGGPVASETLKNLVLPNVGEFTIVDAAEVEACDLGNNFFVEEAYLGKPRAETVCELLIEMNPDVRGHAVVKDPLELIAKNLEFFDSFTVVVATQIYGVAVLELSKYLKAKDIVFINVRANGLIGELRIQKEEHPIIESKPIDDRTDLYIHPEQLARFEELDRYLKSFDLMQRVDLVGDEGRLHTHVPCIAIITQFAEAWEKEYGKLPGSDDYDLQKRFKEELQVSGKYDLKAENYEESKKYAWSVYYHPNEKLDHNVKKILADEKGTTVTAKSDKFWIMVRALRDFMEKEGRGLMPVSTNIPDMHSLPEYYVTLKGIYKKGYERDRDLIRGYLDEILKQLGGVPGDIDNELFERFVKNVRNLRVVRFKAICDEWDTPDVETLNEKFIDFEAMMNPDQDALAQAKLPMAINWNIGLKAADLFYDEHKRLPGAWGTIQLDKDVDRLHELTEKLFKNFELDADADKRISNELVRFGGSEIHNIAAFLGGVTAQAILKLIIAQYVPVNNTFTFVGINCTAAVFNL